MRTISLSDLHVVQRRGADGGKPRSEWRPCDELRVGMHAEVHGRWAAIEHVRPHGMRVAVQLCEVDGSRTVKPLAEGTGMYVRKDATVDMADHQAVLVRLAAAPGHHDYDCGSALYPLRSSHPGPKSAGGPSRRAVTHGGDSHTLL